MERLTYEQAIQEITIGSVLRIIVEEQSVDGKNYNLNLDAQVQTREVNPLNNILFLTFVELPYWMDVVPVCCAMVYNYRQEKTLFELTLTDKSTNTEVVLSEVQAYIVKL